jgi:hypothetical protein
MIRKSSRAFSLVETAIVLGVAGLVLGGLWMAISTVRERARLSQTVTDVAFVVQGVKDFYRNSVAVADASGNMDEARVTHFIIERGLVPPELLRSRSLIGGYYLADHPAVDPAWRTANPTKGSFAVWTLDEGSDYAFFVTLRGVSRASCMILAAKLTGGGEGLSAPMDTEVSGTSYNRPVTPVDANSSCVPDNSNEITLDYRLRDNR